MITTTGHDPVKTLLRVAGEENVTQILVGKPLRHPLMEFLRGGSLVQRLIRQSGDIEVRVVRTGRKQEPPQPLLRWPVELRPLAMEIAIGALSVAVVTGVCWFLRERTGYWAIALIYLTLVVVLATRFRRVTILLVATASAVLWNFLFVPLVFSFRTVQFSDTLMVVMYYIVALVIGQLTSRLRSREMAERKHEQRTAALYRLAQGVVESTTLDEGLRWATREIQNVFHAHTAILLVGENGQLGDHPHPSDTLLIHDKERSLALWSLMHGQPSGRFTDTSPDAESLYLPLKTTKNKVGVLTVHFHDRASLALDERELLETFADQIAVMIERYWLIQQTGRTHLIEESEKLYKTIFDCVSH